MVGNLNGLESLSLLHEHTRDFYIKICQPTIMSLFHVKLLNLKCLFFILSNNVLLPQSILKKKFLNACSQYKITPVNCRCVYLSSSCSNSPVQKFMSRGHSHGHSHTICSIWLQFRHRRSTCITNYKKQHYSCCFTS